MTVQLLGLRPSNGHQQRPDSSDSMLTQAAGDDGVAAAGLRLEQRGQRLRQADLAQHLQQDALYSAVWEGGMASLRGGSCMTVRHGRHVMQLHIDASCFVSASLRLPHPARLHACGRSSHPSPLWNRTRSCMARLNPSVVTCGQIFMKGTHACAMPPIVCSQHAMR